jgi:hypothetical protein
MKARRGRFLPSCTKSQRSTTRPEESSGAMIGVVCCISFGVIPDGKQIPPVNPPRGGMTIHPGPGYNTIWRIRLTSPEEGRGWTR